MGAKHRFFFFIGNLPINWAKKHHADIVADIVIRMFNCCYWVVKQTATLYQSIWRYKVHPVIKKHSQALWNCTYLLLIRIAPWFTHEFHEGDNQPKSQANTQDKEDAAQSVRLYGHPTCLVLCRAGVFPPLLTQVLQLSGLKQLQNGDSQRSDKWRVWENMTGLYTLLYIFYGTENSRTT